MAALSLGGCFNPEYGDIAFACKKGGEECPDGYECQRLGGGKRNCVRQGLKLDGGAAGDGSRDRGPVTDARKDRGPVTDTRRDRGVVTDLPPKPDSSPGGPVVTLVAPANKLKTAAYSTTWQFKVAPKAGGAAIATCKLFVDGKERGKYLGPFKAGATLSMIWGDKTMKVAQHTWYVQCTDANSLTGVSTTRIYEHSPIKLTKCQNKGFVPNSRYIVSGLLQASAPVCLDINASGVIIEGASGAILRGAGHKDLMWHTQTGPVGTLFYKGGKTWKQGWKNNVTTEKHMDSVDARDFTGDDRLEIITASSGGYIRVYKNLGSGSWQTTPTLFTSGKGLGVRRVVDFNQDGFLDIFAGGDGTNEVFYAGTSSGKLNFQSSFGWGYYTRNMDVGHFNSDDKIDVALGSAYTSSLKDYLRYVGVKDSSKNGFSSTWTSSKSNGGGWGPSFVADFDGDKDFDILVPDNTSSGSQKKAIMWLNDGKGNFKLHGLSIFSDQLPVGARDMNGDGKPDVITIGLGSGIGGYIRVHRWQSNGYWKAHKSLVTAFGYGLAHVAFRDLTGDGKPEVIAAGKGANDKIKVYRNDLTATAGSFSSLGDGGVAGTVQSMDVRDMDNDGDLDIIATHYLGIGKGTKLIHYTNVGGGKLNHYTVHSDSQSSRLIAAAVGDLDGEPSFGVRINKGVSGVSVSSLVIRGFAGGVDVLGKDAALTTITVEDPDLFGVRIKNTSGATIMRLLLKHAVRGVGVKVIGSKVSIKSAELCPAGYHPTMTFIGAECINSTVTASGNTASLNNGCGASFMSTFCP